MTDYEALREAFVRLKLVFSSDSSDPEERILRLLEGRGYRDFYCLFVFDPSGKFKEYGIWE